LANWNILYRRGRWKTPSGKFITAKLPKDVNGHFGAGLKSFVLYQNYSCQVTQPLITEQLREIGVNISKGQINNILIHGTDNFHNEKEQILSTALPLSGHINVDDTGARHNGKNGYCTHIGNEYFAWFKSTDSKSRINFLKLLRIGYDDFIINDDDAGQFNIFLHGLCWVHAERTVHKLIGFTKKHTKLLEDTRTDIWSLYRELKDYRLNPNKLKKVELEKQFDELFTRKTKLGLT
jgi:hypothetical protein